MVSVSLNRPGYRAADEAPDVASTCRAAAAGARPGSGKRVPRADQSGSGEAAMNEPVAVLVAIASSITFGASYAIEQRATHTVPERRPWT